MVFGVRERGAAGRPSVRTYDRSSLRRWRGKKGYPARAGAPFGTGSAYGGGEGEIGQTFFSKRAEVPVLASEHIR